MKTIYYTVVEKIEVPEEWTEEQIDEYLNVISAGKEFMWSEEENLLEK